MGDPSGFCLSFSYSFLVVFGTLQALLYTIHVLRPVAFTVTPGLDYSPGHEVATSLYSSSGGFGG